MRTTKVFKRTQDNWYGNYKVVDDQRVSDLVEVSFIKLSDGQFRCCVWGNDDCGVEFDNNNELVVWSIFLQVIGWDNVNRNQLIDLGFISA